MNETFEQFCERMSQVEKTAEYVIGRATSGNTRAIFDFEGQHCHLESFGYRRLPARSANQTPAQKFFAISGPEPTDQWIHCKLIYGPGHAGKGQDRIKRISKHYGAKFQEDPYPWEAGVWFYMYFDGDDSWEKLMKLVWDIHTGKFLELWGEEAKVYESCLGHAPEQEPDELVKTA